MIVGNPSKEAVENLTRDLGILPPHLVKSVPDRGTEIVVIKEGQSYLESGLGKEVDVREIERNAPDLRRQFEDLAKQRGAKTPEEIEEYTRLTLKLNEGKLGDHSGKDTLLSPGKGLLVPGYSFVNGKKVLNEDLRIDAFSRNPESGGEYSESMHRIILKEHALPDPAPGFGHTRAAIHEFGHAVEAGLRYDKTKGKEHDLFMYRHNLEKKLLHKGEYVTEYAHFTNTGEDFAEDFEGFFTRDTGDQFELEFHRGANAENLKRAEPEIYDYIAAISRSPN